MSKRKPSSDKLKDAGNTAAEKVNTEPTFSFSKLLKARVPIGFLIHMGANYLIRNYPLLLEIPLVLLVWWELAKEFPAKKHRTQFLTSALSLFDLLVIHEWNYVAELHILQVSFLRLIAVATVCYFAGIKGIDSIILNYLLFGITCVLVLLQYYPNEVMLTISMSIAGSDCIQYFFGKAFGKTKIVPKISPNKSLEGYIAAIFWCNIIHFWLIDWNYSFLKSFYVNGILFCGIVGDLFISWWKRNHSIKDTSSLLTGHGGFLDRLDSHIAAWIFSYIFALQFSQDGTNFTDMDYSKIEILIAIAWSFVWFRFFYDAFTKGVLI